MSFVIHKIQVNTLGSLLKETRISKGWELDDIEKEIKISKKYLKLLEGNAYYKFSSPIYIEGMLGRYSEFLGLPKDKIVKQWKKEYIPSSLPVYKINRKEMSKPLFFFNIKNIGFILLALIILIYFGFGIKKILLPPNINLTFPQNNLVISQHSVIIKGSTDLNAEVFINNQPIIKATDGHFSQKVELIQGINRIKISAKKKHSKEKIIWRQVIVKE